MEFKTASPDGIILYVADSRQVDFVALYLKEGYVLYGYNLGDDAVLISSTNRYNDDRWHTVSIFHQHINSHAF